MKEEQSEVRKKEEKPEIAAFQDLFKTGADKFKTTHSPK